MIPSDLDEQLRRILMGSRMQGPVPETNPDEGMGLDEIRALGAGMTETAGEDMPPGTKVVFEPEVSAPVRKPLVPRAAEPMLPDKVVQVPTKSPDDIAAAYARAQDKQARRRMAMERGGRELVAGLTRTEVQPVTQRPTDAFARFAASQRAKSQDTLRSQEVANNAARTKAYLDTTAAAGPRAERGLDIKEAELELRGQMAERKADETAEQFEERKRHNRASEGIGWSAAKRASDKAERDDTRLALKTDALKPRAGWEPIEAGAPTFRDAAQAKAFDSSVAAMGAIRNHKEHVLHGLEELKKAPTPAAADEALAKINAQMGALASKLRDAEGLNNTDASNHAVDTMLSLTNGSIVNLKNIANQGRLPAILNAAINSGEANLETMAQSNNLRRAKSGQAAPRKTATLADGSKVQLSADGKSWEPIK